MQQPEIRTITEPEHFGQIIKDYYEKGQLSVKLSNNNLLIEFLKTGENNTIFFNASNNIKNLPKECLIVAKFNDELVYGTMQQIEQKKDVFVFVPLKFQIIKLFRKDQRIDINSGGKQIVFISDIVSHVNLETDIITEKKKTEQIKSKVTFELGKIFEKIKVFFIGEKQIDSRFRYFMTNTNAMYIPDINAPDGSSSPELFRQYMDSIYSTDYQLKNSGLVSEITTPLLYKNQMPFGYIQINSTQTLATSVTSQLKTYASHIEQIFEKNNIFKPSAERLIVIDVSQGGFAIAFKDKKFLRLFKLNSSMCIKMLFADKELDMYVAVRNVTLDAGMIVVGFQILTIEKPDVYDNFLKSLSSNTAS